jgi:hypothetical protein
MIIDPNTDIGKLRLRLGDWSDLPILPDSVYEAVLASTSNDLSRSTVTLANYILAIFAQRSHKKLQQLEQWSGETFVNYRRFIIDTINSPNTISGIYPIPFSASSTTESPLVKFVKDWNDAYRYPNQSQVLSDVAAINQ